MDIGAYFERIAYGGATAPTRAILAQLHWHHASHIPFENLDVILGRGVDLAPAAIARKLVSAQRGGYCFEQNGLYLRVLRQMGFDAAAIAARVWWGWEAAGLPPRTHMALKIDLGSECYLSDVGFGGLTPVMPLRLVLTEVQQTTHEAYRLMPLEDGPAKGETVLQAFIGGAWLNLYSFLPQPIDPTDFGIANWYVSTHPQSLFTREMIVAMPFENGRRVLQQRKLTMRGRDGSETVRMLAGPDDLAEALAGMFGLALSTSEIARLWAALPAD